MRSRGLVVTRSVGGTARPRNSETSQLRDRETLLHVLPEKLDGSLPSVGCCVGLVDLFARVVKERVIRAGIDHEMHALAHILQRLLDLPSLFGSKARIFLAVDQQNR